MLHHRIATAFAVLVLAAPVVARAQNAAPAAAVQEMAKAAPVQNSAVAPAPVGVRASTSVNAPVALPAPVNTSRNVALMIVGGAALIVGAIVGGRTGTIIMVGGGVIGLLGLWNYLQ